MKQQVVLIGGQLIPAYLGIKERKPDIVHLIFTNDSKLKLKYLISQFNNIDFHQHQVEPYAFDEISVLVEELIFNADGGNWELNLTGGTKVMALAAQNVFKGFDLESFYIDQKSRMFFFNDKRYLDIKGNIKISTFLKLSGHKDIRRKTLSDYSKEDFQIAEDMYELHRTKNLDWLYGQIATDIGDRDCQENYFKEIPKAGSVRWMNGVLEIKTSKIDYKAFEPNSLEICFTGLWWELVVAQQVRSWDLKQEMMIGVELLSKNVGSNAKNEIDIVLNTGKNMIFIECKSGKVKQEDINKMRAVTRVYGGLASRSILVCRKLPRPDLLEKCSDLGIEVFALQSRNKKSKKKGVVPITSLSQLNVKLSNLVDQMQL
jgi:hypothetical protein